VPDVEPCITDTNGHVIADVDATGAPMAAAPELRDLATVVRDMRAAQKAYDAKRVPRLRSATSSSPRASWR
jgi:hypothetical protein